jgi:hypothetical protein
MVEYLRLKIQNPIDSLYPSAFHDNMKKIPVICIIFLAYCNINIVSAQTLPPLPSLESVMKKNEKLIQTNLIQEKNKTKKNKKLPIFTNTTKVLSYQTLIT